MQNKALSTTPIGLSASSRGNEQVHLKPLAYTENLDPVKLGLYRRQPAINSLIDIAISSI